MGYGGFVATNSRELEERVRNYREFDCVENYEPRFNFQVSDLNAALGRSQLRKINAFLSRREHIRNLYDEYFDTKGIPRQSPSISCYYNNYRYIIRLSAKECEKFSSHLLSRGIKTIVPIEKYELLHNYLQLSRKDFPISEKVSQTTLSLPIFPALTDADINQIIEAIKSF